MATTAIAAVIQASLHAQAPRIATGIATPRQATAIIRVLHQPPHHVHQISIGTAQAVYQIHKHHQRHAHLVSTGTEAPASTHPQPIAHLANTGTEVPVPILRPPQPQPQPQPQVQITPASNQVALPQAGRGTALETIARCQLQACRNRSRSYVPQVINGTEFTVRMRDKQA